MADDSWYCFNPPLYQTNSSSYINFLTEIQKEETNLINLERIRNNHSYLKRNPEIRALIALMVRHVLLLKPRTNIPAILGKYFSRPRFEIQKEVDDYLEVKGLKQSEESAINYEEEESSDILKISEYTVNETVSEENISTYTDLTYEKDYYEKLSELSKSQKNLKFKSKLYSSPTDFNLNLYERYINMLMIQDYDEQ